MRWWTRVWSWLREPVGSTRPNARVDSVREEVRRRLETVNDGVRQLREIMEDRRESPT